MLIQKNSSLQKLKLKYHVTTKTRSKTPPK